MTYQEIKDRLTKCELTLEKIKDGSYKGKDVTEKTQKLELLKESYQKLLAEAEKGMVFTDDEKKAKELSDDGANVKLTSEMKPGSEEAGEHERFKRLSPKDQETINKIRSMMQAEKDSQNEVVDPSITQILVDFIALMGMGYTALQAVKKLGDEHGDISVDSIMKALKGKQEVDENEAEDTEGGDLDVGHQDDEPDMLKQYAYDIATYAAKLYKQLDKYDKMDGEVDFPNWWQSKVILAKDYISKAQHYLEFEEKQPAIDALALEGKDGASKGEETKFHKDLDTLVHKTFGKRKEELEEASANAIKKEYDALVGKMKQLAQHYKTAEGDAKAKIVAALKQHTARKRELEAQLDQAVSGMGAGQELDTNINEYRGVQDDVIEIIKDMALNGDGDEIEAAMEIMEFIGEHYKIDFEFGRAGGGNYGRNDGAPYEGVKENQEGKNIDVYGYQTKHFDICPGATKLFSDIKAGEYTDGVPSANEQDKLVKLAKLHDALFGIEKVVLKGVDQNKGKELFSKTLDVASDIYELGLELGLDRDHRGQDLDYIQMHVEKINDLTRDDKDEEIAAE